MGLIINVGRLAFSKLGLLASGLLGFVGGSGVSGVSRLLKWGVIAFGLWLVYENFVKGK